MRNSIKLFAFTLLSVAVNAANHYVRDGASGSADGSSWTDAWDDLPAALTRGDTYYVADGTYATYIFDDAESGTNSITIIKATGADHGTDTGWDSSYGDGQADFAAPIEFWEGYYEFNGNGSATIPTDTSSDYGFKISDTSTNRLTGTVQFGASGYTVSNITFKYVHVHNDYDGSINNGTVGVRFNNAASQTYIKVQNCFLENCGKDGIQISASSYLLFERNWVKRYGLLEGLEPNYHGQTIQLFYGGDNIVFRYNMFESCEGQALLSIAGIGNPSENIRFYGNVVFNDYGATNAASGGFNSSGGIIGNAWYYTGHDGLYVYNNTFVNIGGEYEGDAHFPMNVAADVGLNEYGYNNMFINCGPTAGALSWSAWDYHASDGAESYGGANEQTVTSAIMADYTGGDYTLSMATDSGFDVTSELWWDASADSFFGSLDSEEDITGTTRGSDGTWDIGAYEYDASVPVIPTATVGTLRAL